MKANELRAKNGDDLQKELNDLLKAQFGLRMQHATQQLANITQIRKASSATARVRTVMKEKTAKGPPQPRSRPAPPRTSASW